jgi:hypothetical protein
VKKAKFFVQTYVTDATRRDVLVDERAAKANCSQEVVHIVARAVAPGGQYVSNHVHKRTGSAFVWRRGDEIFQIFATPWVA